MVPALLAPADEMGLSAKDEALARELFGDESPEVAESDGQALMETIQLVA